MGPDLAKFRIFGKILNSLSILLRVYLTFGNSLDLFWQIFNATGQIFSIVNGQTFKNNLAIWSHWQMT